MADNKTKPTTVEPEEFIASIEHEVRRADAETLKDLMAKVTGYEAKMWGPSIVGFGRYKYEYESGRSGEWMMVGFSPRKANQVLYLMPGYQDFDDERSRLGKHKIGKSCLYINKLADVDLDVVEEMVTKAVAELKATHETFPE